MGERRRDPNGRAPEEHLRAHGLLGPYVLGELEPDEEEAVERHIARCDTCRDEERGLREINDRLAGVSLAASSAPPDLKARILAELPPRDGSGATSGGTSRSVSRTVATVAAAVLLVFALAAVAYSSGLFGRAATAATLAPTELAPGASGELALSGSGPNLEGSLEVQGLPQTGPDEYYELWIGKEGGRISAGTFTVDESGRGTLSTCAPGASGGGYQRAGITLEKFPEEPRMANAQVVLRGDLQDS